MSEVEPHRRWLRVLLLPSLLGGAAGSLLLLSTPEKLFARLAPWLVLFATALFAMQWLRGATVKSAAASGAGERAGLVALLGQFAVAVYGGYFGAGIGILMLVVLASMGLDDIHAMNGLKNFFGICINAVAAVVFVAGGLVDWPAALVVLAGAVAGGWTGAHFGRWIGPQRARAAVVVIGTLVGVLLLARGI